MELRSWLLLAVGIQILVMFFGTFVIKKFSNDNKKTFKSKLVPLSALPLFLVFYLNIPIIVDYFPDELFENKILSSNLNNVELQETIKEQSKQTKILVDEVKRLRKEITEVNDYYGHFAQFFLIGGLVVCILYLLGRDEIDPDQIERFPLGLSEEK